MPLSRADEHDQAEPAQAFAFRAAPPMAGYCRQSSGACSPLGWSMRLSPRKKGIPCRPCRARLIGRCSVRSGGPRMKVWWDRRRQSLQRAGHDAAAGLRCPCPRRRNPHLRERRSATPPNCEILRRDFWGDTAHLALKRPRGGRFFRPGSKTSSNGSQYARRRVDDGYGLLSLALPQRVFCTLIG